MTHGAREASFEAVVVGGANTGEADRVVRLLGPNGRLSAFAANAKRSRRRFGGALENFHTVRVQLTRGRGDLWRLESAELTRSRLPLRQDFNSITLAAYFAELATAVAPEEAACDAIYSLLGSALDTLCHDAPTHALRRVFEARLLAAIGQSPLLDRCCDCGGPVDLPATLDIERGGLVCGAHPIVARRVGPKTVAWLLAILESECLDPLAGYPAEWADTAARKLDMHFRQGLQAVLPFEPRSAALLEDLPGPEVVA